ncbi:putative DNA endonuclease VII [Vibrio phage phiKT1024]|nr:putative DNA endonuclease VII [Vibrio phage phiKT1024]
MEQLRQLKASEVKEVREDILKEQGGVCALCGEEIDEHSGASLDHQHMLKRETVGEDGAGLVRGVLCRQCNVMEGKIWNNMGRYIQPENVQERIEWLESLISYYRKDNYDLIHPNEKPAEPKVSKKNYNKLKREYHKDIENGLKKRKFPEYPKSGKMTIGLMSLFEEYDIPPYNDSDMKS